MSFSTLISPRGTVWALGQAVLIICLRESKIERVIGSGGCPLHLNNEVPLILKRLAAKRFPMGLASRSSQPLWARDLFKLFVISGSFA